jgi:HTH-type transcriptional regulator/antitoxin HigA
MPIKPIKTEKDHKDALRRIEALWDAEPNTRKGDELSVLILLVDNYENEHHKILPPDPIEAIKFRMEQMGLKKTDLAKILGGRNRATEILNRKRGLSVRMMRTLHSELDIPLESLVAEPAPEYAISKTVEGTPMEKAKSKRRRVD